MIELPPYVTRDFVHERLQQIFPAGTPNRNYCVREMAASTVFAMLYTGAIEGNERYIGPKHVYRMSNEQAEKSDDNSRNSYATEISRKSFSYVGSPWYADTTREPIRDETLRDGLVHVGAVLALANVSTTSSKPRYALSSSFASLFDPSINGEELERNILAWQEANLSAAARMRLRLASRSAHSATHKVLVTFPNGEARNLSFGSSSDITKAVIEVFAPMYLEDPTVLWVSTSDAKVGHLDNEMAEKIGLKIQADRDLPDVILADLGRDKPLLIFVEVVATDGAVTDRRQAALYNLTDSAGFTREQVVFVTAYDDRQAAGFKKTIPHLAWNTFAWFMSEPDKIVIFKDGAPKIVDML